MYLSIWRLLPVLNLVMILILSSLTSCAQYVSQNKSIIGTWLSENKGQQKLVFNSDGSCLDYFSVGDPIKYTYSFTNKLNDCDTNMSGIAEIGLFYLQLRPIKYGAVFCYVVNELSQENLSVSPFGKSGVELYFRQKKK